MKLVKLPISHPKTETLGGTERRSGLVKQEGRKEVRKEGRLGHITKVGRPQEGVTNVGKSLYIFPKC